MPMYICVREGEVREDNLLPVVLRAASCEETGDGESALLVLWVESPWPGCQSFESVLDEACKDPMRRERVMKVVRDADSLYEPERGSEEYVLYKAFGEALIGLMEADPSLCEKFVKSYRALYRKFRGELVLAEAPARSRFTLCFKMKEVNEELEADIIAPSSEKWLPRGYYDALKRLVQDTESRERLHDVINRFLDFARGVEPASDEAKHLCAFAKALLDFADETPEASLAELHSRADLRAGVYEFIITNESSIEERKAYLDRFVAVEEDYGIEQSTFDKIMRDLKRDQTDPGIARQTGMFIAEHWLKIYDLDNAAKVLKDIASLKHRGSNISRLLLKTVGSLYSKTPYWGAGFVMLLLILMSPALLPTTSPLYQLLEWASLSVLALFYVGAVSLPAVVLRESRKDKVPYFQLFFPRLFGATVVGFIALVFDDTPWQIGSGSGWFTVILIGALSYLAWAAYLHVDADKRLAMLRSREWRSVMRASGQLFWIGLMQSVTIAVIVSTLFSPMVLPDEMGGITLDCFAGAVGICPTLIFMFAGAALFIGAFAQLLWQA